MSQAVETTEQLTVDPALASLRRSLWYADYWLEDRFDWIVNHGQGPDTAAKLAELHEHALGAK
jgi:hypothetical protein